MGLADSFRSGVGAVNDLYDVRMKKQRAESYPEELDTANKMAAAKLLYQNYENQFAPEKMGLENQYLQSNITGKNLENQWYSPNMESSINARDTETKYLPLKYGIAAESALKGSSRYDDSQKFLRSVGEMPAAQRAIWFADPDNYDYYTKMQKELQGNMGKEQKNQIITPEFLQQFGLGGGIQDAPQSPQMQTQPGGMAAPMPSPQQQQQMPMGQSPQMPQGMLPQGSPQQMPMQAPVNPQQANIPGVGMVNTPPQQGGVQQQDTNVAEQAAKMATVPGAPTPELTSKERTQLGFEVVANQKATGSQMTNIAQGAVRLELFLQDNKDTFAPRLENAAKYAGAIGRGQKAIDQLKKETPQAYLDYLWVTKDFIPNLGNNIKVMEKLASTDQQREALNEMNSSAFRWDVDPKSAVKYLNMGFNMFGRQSKAALKAAQPIHPGALEKLNGIKSVSETGDYVSQPKTKQIKGQKFKFVNGDWYRL